MLYGTLLGNRSCIVKVAILDDYQGIALEAADWSVLPEDVEVRVFRDHLDTLDAVAERLGGFEIVSAMRERTPFGRELLQRLPDLQLLVTTGARNAAIDMDAATELGVMVCGTGGLGYPTAELTWAIILALLRHIPHEDSGTRQGRWQTTTGIGLNNKVLGVLGLGRLGSQVATIGEAFGMEIIAWSQNMTEKRARQFHATLVTKDQLLARSDIVSIHLQISDRTSGLIGERELGLMKSTAYLINTSRGPIVDEAALISALRACSIAGAGLDVYDQEPLPPNHPLMQLDNTVLTPHIGFATLEGYNVFYGETVEDIAAYLRGQPVRVINPAVMGKDRGSRQ